jgi:hypothetical protein
VKLGKGKVGPGMPRRHAGGGEVRLQQYALLTWALDGGEWSGSHPDRCTPRTHGKVGWYRNSDDGKTVRLCREWKPGFQPLDWTLYTWKYSTSLTELTQGTNHSFWCGENSYNFRILISVLGSC